MKKQALVGRSEELRILEALYKAKGSHIIAIYGRRRVGKSALVESFLYKKLFLRFEGLEGLSTKEQIREFTQDLLKQTQDPLLKKVVFDSWNEVFDYLTTVIKKRPGKTVLFFDELQWLANNHVKLISLIKKYWDQDWKKDSVLLILCGSIASFMVKKVIHSSALYGRISKELLVKPLSPEDTSKLLKPARSATEILIYNLVFGGIPKYWEEITPSKSANQNINDLYFKRTGYLFNDYEKVFYSQFKEYRTYEEIVLALQRPLTMDEISKKVKMRSGGGLKFYLQNLENANFIKGYVPYDKADTSKLKKYRLVDEPLRFYFKFVAPHKKMISENSGKNLFQILTNNQWEPWLGFALENFCLKNAMLIAKKMGFEDEVVSYGPYFNRGSEGFQIDLLYRRRDKTITLCEIKFYAKPVTATVIQEVEKKVALLTVPRGYTLEKALISVHGLDPSVKDLGYFHHTLNILDLF